MTLILKLTNQCNLRCKYCSVGRKDNSTALSEKELCLVIDQFAALSSYRHFDRANVIFHGGEPAMLPPSLYDRLIRYAIKNHPTTSFSWCMQTNGTLISNEFMDVFKKYDVSIGVSVDGNREIHNRNRIYKNGRGTYDNVIRGIEKLIQNDIKTAALFVYTDAFKDTAVENALGDIVSLGVPLKINPLISCGMASGNKELSSEGYADFLARVFHYYVDKKISIPLNPIDDIFNAMFRDTHPDECAYSPSCGSKFIAVDQNGSIYPCGRYSDNAEACLGNITSTTLSAAVDDPIMKRLAERRKEPALEKCAVCKYIKLCNSGCPVAFGANAESGSRLCTEYKRLFKFLSTTGVDTYTQILKQRKQEAQKTVFEVYQYPFSLNTADEITCFESRNMYDIRHGSDRTIQEGEIFLLARKEERLIGLISFLIDEPFKRVEIKSMQIAPEFRLSNLFKKLIKSVFVVFERVRDKEFLPETICIAVHKHNEYSIKIYRKLGFVFDYNSEQKDNLLHGTCSVDDLQKRLARFITI